MSKGRGSPPASELLKIGPGCEGLLEAYLTLSTLLRKRLSPSPKATLGPVSPRTSSELETLSTLASMLESDAQYLCLLIKHPLQQLYTAHQNCVGSASFSPLTAIQRAWGQSSSELDTGMFGPRKGRS